MNYDYHYVHIHGSIDTTLQGIISYEQRLLYVLDKCVYLWQKCSNGCELVVGVWKLRRAHKYSASFFFKKETTSDFL